MSWEEKKWHMISKQNNVDYSSYYSKKNSLVVATFNVLFDIFPEMEGAIQSPIRYAHHMKKVLPSIKADVLALQEVTEQYLAKLLEQEWVRNDYYVTQFSNKTTYNPTRDTNRRFMVVILSKIPILESYLYFFDKKNCPQGGRPAVVCMLPYPGKTNSQFVISSLHLKAGIDFFETRSKQWGELFRLFGIVKSHNKDKNQPTDLVGKTSNVIILGDTNMQRPIEEEDIVEQIVDVWKTLKPNEEGYTYCYKTNPMITQMNADDSKQMRFDRILMYSSGTIDCGNWKPKQTVMFANQTFSSIHTTLMPSDHYGLAAQLMLE
jgi:endonuclease/exonuclease/phosphatase family metal-dependent hydrolase